MAARSRMPWISLALALVVAPSPLPAAPATFAGSATPASASLPSAPVAAIGAYTLYYGKALHVVATIDPAARAGLRRGDIVESLDGEPMTSAEAFVRAIHAHAVGERLVLTILRSGVQSTVDVVTVAATAAMLAQERDAVPATVGVFFVSAQGAPVIAAALEKWPGAKAGLQRGDIIRSVNGTPVDSGQAAYDAIAALPAWQNVSLLVARNGTTQTVDVTTTALPPGFPVSLEGTPKVSGGTLSTTTSTDARAIPAPAADAPIEILAQGNGCGSGYYGLTLENVSSKTVTHVLFLIEMLSPFATILESHAFVLSGEFSPAVMVDMNGNRGTPLMDDTGGTSFNTNRPCFQMPNRHGPLFTQWVPRVVKVAFDDGSVWSANGTYPLIMPPPVQAATVEKTTTTTGVMGFGFSLESLCSTPRC